MVLTQATCVVTSDYFQWSFGKKQAHDKPLSIRRFFPVKDVTQVDMYDVSPCRLRLTVNGDVDTPVVLQFQTEATLLETVTALRTSWENQRKTDIEVSTLPSSPHNIIIINIKFCRKLWCSIWRRRARA